MSKPAVSIITGYYKREDVVRRTLSSLLDQNFKDIEIIVFDDASPDGTAAEIKAFIEEVRDPRIVPIYHTKNIGFVAGLLDALKHAKGQYIAIQGSGDYSYPDRIALQKALLDERPEVGVVGSYYENYVADSQIVRLRTPNADTIDLVALLQNNVFTHGEVMFRRDAYEQAGGYREQFTFCQDYDLWLRMISYCKFATVPQVLYRRFIDFEGVSYNPKKFIAQTRYKILAKQLRDVSCTKEQEILSVITQENLGSFVPLNTPELQKDTKKAVIRAVVWKNYDLARTLTQIYIVSRPSKIFFSTAVALIRFIPFLHSFVLFLTKSRKET
ncbi:MAG: glycosyltransferase family 2 protein [Alphaproteobacteria bacterium]